MRKNSVKVHMRLSADEYQQLRSLARANRVGQAELLRKMIDTYQVEQRPETGLKELTIDLRRIGMNLNQIVAAVNSRGLLDVPFYRQQITELEDVCMEIRASLLPAPYENGYRAPPPQSHRDHQIVFRLPAEENKKLELLAEQTGRSKSALVRAMLAGCRVQPCLSETEQDFFMQMLRLGVNLKQIAAKAISAGRPDGAEFLHRANDFEVLRLQVLRQRTAPQEWRQAPWQ